MISEIVTKPQVAAQFHEYMFITDQLDREAAGVKKIEGFAAEIERECTPEGYALFKRFLESPFTVGGQEAFGKLGKLTPSIPHWQEIVAAFPPAREHPKRAKYEYAGCATTKHARFVVEILEFPAAQLLEKWALWNQALKDVQEERRVSREHSKNFKNGDRVRFKCGDHCGSYGTVKDMEHKSDQCFVMPVQLTGNKQPKWDAPYEGTRMGGFFQELEKV